MKAIVIYKSVYGATEQYAKWIGEALECRVTDQPKEVNLEEYDTIVFGGGLYAGGISGIDVLKEHYEAIKDKDLYLFTVGLADPNGTDYTKIKDMSLSHEMQQNIKIYHLRGGIDYSKLSVKHKAMMWMMKKMTQKKKEKDEEDLLFLSTYGQHPDFKNRDSIAPMISAIKGA